MFVTKFGHLADLEIFYQTGEKCALLVALD